MKHTPGPWTTHRWNDDQYIVEIGDSTGWKKDHPEAYIAKIGGWGYAGNGNAALIAAAPKLQEENIRLREALQIAEYRAYFDEAKYNELFQFVMSFELVAEENK